MLFGFFRVDLAFFAYDYLATLLPLNCAACSNLSRIARFVNPALFQAQNVGGSQASRDSIRCLEWSDSGCLAGGALCAGASLMHLVVRGWLNDVVSLSGHDMKWECAAQLSLYFSTTAGVRLWINSFYVDRTKAQWIVLLVFLYFSIFCETSSFT